MMKRCDGLFDYAPVGTSIEQRRRKRGWWLASKRGHVRLSRVRCAHVTISAVTLSVQV